MSSNSYPSPISSSAPSPQFNTTPIDPLVPFQPHRTRQAQADRPLTPPHDIDTVAASVRTRLEQVRSDLLGFSNGLQEPASQLRPRGGVGPTHEAIMLTGEPSGETPTSEDTSSNMSTQELIDAYDYSFRRVVQAQSSLALMAEQASFLRQSIDHIPTPPIEPPAHGRFRHQPLPLQSPRTLGPSLTDDSFTTMGRRVAAREHAAQQSRALSRTDTLPADDPPDAPRTTQPSTRFVPGELQRDVSLAAREVELQTIQSRQLRQEAELQAIQTRQLRQEIELQNAEAMRLRRELSELQLQSIEARRLSQVPTHLASPTNLGGPLLWRQEPRRRRLIRPEPRPSSTGSRSSGSGSGAGTGSTLSSEQSRLSILSGSLHDMQNFSSPASATPSMFPGTRSLIFEEPENWVESPRGVMDNADIMVDEVSNGRNYLVRRRITPEGTERVQNVTLPEPTDADLLDFYGPRDLPNELEAARRRTMLQAFHDRTSRAPSMLSLTNQTIPRRRGWARLDADGNEVPPDEEEEFLERNSAELRVRRARDAPAGPLLFDPDSASRPGPQTFGGSLERTVEGLAARGPVDHSEVPRRQRTTGDLIDKPDVRRRLDPLPMALDGMVASSKCARYLDDDPVVVVGRWASFAGR